MLMLLMPVASLSYLVNAAAATTAAMEVGIIKCTVFQWLLVRRVARGGKRCICSGCIESSVLQVEVLLAC